MPRTPSEQLPERSTREGFKATAIEAARIAGTVLTEHARNGFRVEHKDTVNLVTDADRCAEQAVVDVIKKAYPTHHILAEERGLRAGTDSPYKWVIDPLDGTTNFAHGSPAYCVSIGLEYQGRAIPGSALDPTPQHLFVAEPGRRAPLNGAPRRVCRTVPLEAVAFPQPCRCGMMTPPFVDQEDSHGDTDSPVKRTAQRRRKTGGRGDDAGSGGRTAQGGGDP